MRVMIGKSLNLRWRTVLMVGACIASVAGCTHPVLGRPVLLGASVTAGAGAAVVSGEAREQTMLSVDAGVAYAAVVTAPHATPLDFGDNGVMADPTAALREQAYTAAAQHPTLVIAIDWLFWPLHQSFSSSLPADELAAMRLAAVDAALKELECFDCPVVVGDVPNMTRAAGGLLRDDRDPSDAVRAQANARIRSWASVKPNRCVLAVSMLAECIHEDKGFEIAGLRYEAGEGARLVQQDGLHATAEGLAVLVSAAIAQLEQASLIEGGQRETNHAQLKIGLEREAIAAKNRSAPTLLGALSLASMKTRIEAALDRKDDAAAATELDAIYARLESFDQSPFGEQGEILSWAFLRLTMTAMFAPMPKTNAVTSQHWSQLGVEAMADHPNLWRFELWLRYADELGDECQNQTMRALEDRRKQRGPWIDPLGPFLWDNAETYLGAGALARCFADPAEAYRYACARAVASEMIANGRTALGKGDGSSRKFGGEPFLQYSRSLQAAGLPDVAETFLANARTAGFGNAIDASARSDQLRHGNWNFGFTKIQSGADGCFSIASENARAMDAAQAASKPSLIPCVPLFASSAFSFPLPSLGFGNLESFDGAAAALGENANDMIVTRAELSADGRFHLKHAPRESTPVAASWFELGRSDVKRLIRIQSLQPGIFGVEAIARDAQGFDLASFTEAVRSAAMSTSSGAALQVNPFPGMTGVWKMALPTAVRAIGTVKHATVRLPIGSDDASGAARFATFELENESVILLGVLEAPEGIEVAQSTLRLHAVWGSREQRATGEIMSMQGFIAGSAQMLKDAIHDKATAGAEVRVKWEFKLSAVAGS